MSGIVGLLNLDGAPVDASLLDRMTRFLAFRGPDAQGTWTGGPAGMGHTLLITAEESKRERQPTSLDGDIWITADARIDARSELIRKLRALGRQVPEGRPDAELILLAYHAWGPACVDHLIGDFVFAIWDAPARRLFCARDQFGMKPFFYAQTASSLLFSNTLDGLHLHPEVSSRFNELAIADFLLFDTNQDLGTTFFADILRLPPAHTLEWKDGRLTIRRYWKLPEPDAVHYKNPQECVDRFREVFDAAVSDRLRSSSAAILLSGGLDSPTVAASARRVVDRRSSPVDLRAFTHFHERLIPHDERRYAGLVGEALRIPIRYLPGDECQLYDYYQDADYQTPEPRHLPGGFRKANPFLEALPWCRTLLTGFGGDPALACLLSAHFRKLFRARQYGRMIKDAASFLGAEGRLSRLYLRTRWRRLFGRAWNAEFPGWMNPEFVERLGLKERWEHQSLESTSSRAVRPEAYESLTSQYWTTNLEPYDPGITRFPVEVCHPFFDLRVLNFLLALPAIPWCSDKEILRRAGRPELPDAVRLRKKTPLAGDPIVAWLQKPEAQWVDHFEAIPELRSYVRRDLIPKVWGTEDSAHAWVHLRPLSLNLWLQRQSSASYKIIREGIGEYEQRFTS